MNLIVETQKLQNYLKAKDFKTVVYGCEKLITKFPNNAFLFNLLGLALHGNGNYLIAIDKFKRALDLDPNFLNSFIWLSKQIASPKQEIVSS